MSKDRVREFKSYDEQIELLKSRNLIITDHNKAKDILKEIPYYTLINGYKNTFLQNSSTEKYLSGLTLEMLQDIHYFDMDLSSILLKHILFVEKSFKAKIAYEIAKSFGEYDGNIKDPNSYLYYKNYSSSRKPKGTLQRILKEIRNPIPNSPTYYYKKTKDHVPPWIIVNDIPLGMTIWWYRILKPEHKSSILSEFKHLNALEPQMQKEWFIKSLDLIKEYRNKIAHGNRTFEAQISTCLPKFPLLELYDDTIIRDQEYKENLGNKDVYATILAVASLINDEYVFIRFAQDLERLVNENKQKIYCGYSIFDIFSLPHNLLNRIDNIYNHFYVY